MQFPVFCGEKFASSRAVSSEKAYAKNVANTNPIGYFADNDRWLCLSCAKASHAVATSDWQEVEGLYV